MLIEGSLHQKATKTLDGEQINCLLGGHEDGKRMGPTIAGN